MSTEHVRQLNKTISRIRSLAAECEDAAAKQRPQAFVPIKEFLEELNSLISTGKSVHVGNLQSPTFDNLAFMVGWSEFFQNREELCAAVSTSIESMKIWQPIKREHLESIRKEGSRRPKLVLDSRKYPVVAERQKREFESFVKSKGKTELAQRKKILGSIETVLAILSDGRNGVQAGNAAPVWKKTPVGIEFCEELMTVRCEGSIEPIEVERAIVFNVLRFIANKGEKYVRKLELENSWEKLGGDKKQATSDKEWNPVPSVLTPIRKILDELGKKLEKKGQNEVLSYRIVVKTPLKD